MGSESKEVGFQQLGNAERYVRYYVLCLLDILGQSERLKLWSDIEPGQPLPPNVIEALRGTVGAVEHLRSEFKSIFSQLGKSTIAPEAWDKLPVEMQAAYKRSKLCNLQTQCFSDTLVFYSPVINDIGDMAAAIALNRMLNACATVMLLNMANGLVVRGAITIGTGMELGDHEVYGPALAEAHSLESKCAGHPRILVSETAVNFLAATDGFSGDPKVNTALASLNRNSRGLFFRDADGQYSVDFLGRQMKHTATASSSGKLLREKAISLWRFATKARTIFQMNGDTKHATRYEHLVEYIESRLALWGIDAEALGHVD